MNSDSIRKIYLAEDDADDRSFFEDAVKELALPIQVTCSNNGNDLMTSLATVESAPPPHIIFLDLNMPQKNGFECLEEIRSSPKLKNIPVVIFSTTVNEDAVTKTYNQGANYYVCKPRTFALWVKAIETILLKNMWQQPQPDKEKYVLAIA